MYDDPTLTEREAGGNAQLVREHRKLISTARSLRIFADDDPVATLALWLLLVGIIHGYTDPKAAAFVPSHADWFAAQIRLGREQLDFKTFRSHEMLPRLGRVERLLHLGKWLALCIPYRTRWIEGYACIYIFEGLHVGPFRRHGRLRRGHDRLCRGSRIRRDNARILPDSPADSTFYQVLKARVAPGALVVPPRGVEHSTLALRAHPCPGLPDSVFLSVLQNSPVLLVVLGVDVCLIPALETLETFHHGMIWLDNCSPKCGRAMTQELGTDELDVAG